MALTVMSLCSGIGGLDLGLKLAVPHARTVVFVEREAFCVHALLQRMEEGLVDPAPIWTDLLTFDAKPWRGAVDLIVGGYPCQPFSFAGKRLGEADPRHLWPRIRSIVEEVRPPYVFFENVPGHVSLGLREVLSDLVDLGYRVESPAGEPTFGLFSAAEVGATHRRERLFILGKLGDATDHGLHGPKIHEEGKGDAGARVRSPESPRAGGERVQALADAECVSSQRRRKSGYVAQALGKPQAISQKWERGWHSSRGCSVSGVSGQDFDVSAWPPGPDDLQAWQEVLAVDASLEPSLCRVAHGIPSRVDRLRALGNAVVPEVAARAWSTLYGRLLK